MAQQLQERGFESLEGRITYRFAVIASRMSAALAPSHVERHGLSTAAWRVLAVIGRYEPLSAKDLASLTTTDAFKVTRVLTALSQKKLILREIDLVDRRRVSLRLTRTGRAVHDEIATSLGRIERRILDGLTAREQTALFQLLDKLDARIRDSLD